jgi:RNA polymerase sigma-70 factor (sigma-E family)
MDGEAEREYVEYVSARLPALRRAAYLLCRDPHRADDIVQATTTALYRRWHRARDADSLDAYVHRMLVRKYLDERRLLWAGVRLMRQTPDAVEQPVSRVEDREELRAALARLPHAQRTVLVLRFVCDMSVEQVAQVLDCSPSNVKSHCARGLAAMRKTIRAGGISIET